MKDNLFTGERVFNHKDSVLYQVSRARYLFALNCVKNKRVLDIACGTGYGTSILARKSKSILGLDIDADTIKYCRNKYKKKNLEFQKIYPGYELSLTFKKRFDVIVSFETIEHVQDYLVFLKFLKRSLELAGVLILSSPNNFLNIHPPENHFHKREFDIIALYAEIKKIFPNYKIDLYGQNKTNILRNSGRRNNVGLKRRVLGLIIKNIYEFDSKYLRCLRRIEHLKFYKVVGALQRDYKVNKKIYKINPDENFFNPAISIFVVSKK